MQDIYGNNHQPAGTPGAGRFAPKAGVGSDDDLDSTEALHRLASITDRAGDERMERERAAFVESHPDLAIGHVSYDRGDGRYDQDFYADEFDRIVSSDPRLASDYSNMLRDRFGLGGRR